MSGLRLHPGVRAIPARTGVFLRSDLTTFLVRGRDAQAFQDRVLSLLDGTRDRAAIAAEAGERAGSVIDALAARGMIAEGEVGPRDGLSAFVRALGGDARRVEAAVVVAGRASWADAAARALAAAGARVSREVRSIAGAALVIGAVDPGDRAATARISADAHRAGTRSLWGQVAGPALIVGPLVVPGETACRVCAEAEIQPGRRAVRGRARPLDAALLADLAALHALTILAGAAPSRLGGRILIEDREARTSSLASLVRLPSCPVCGEASR